MSLLSGPVVFIDDEIHDTSSRAHKLLLEIAATGRPVTTDVGIPDSYKERFQHWTSLAFVIVDWDLTPGVDSDLAPGSMGLHGGATLSGFNRQALFDFLDDLMGKIYCPVFIVSDEDVDDIRRQVEEEPRFQQSGGFLDGRLAVFSKEVVMDHLVEHLAEWVAKSPALSALKAWEQEHDEAKNRLFFDLTCLEPDWPAYVWQAADIDEVDPAYELATVISTNLLNRLNPVVFDVESISTPSESPTGRALRQVSLGRTSVPGDRLSDRMVLPGDVFMLPGDNEDELWINVSPACHTVGRAIPNGDGTTSREPVRLHLLRGKRQAWPKNEGSLKQMNSKDRSNSIIIHTLKDEHPYKFVFSDARIEEWEAIAEHRVVRLLPPFITRVQQLHSAFMQSEGLPRVTIDLYAS
ncbi:hypothetical protein G5T42_11715 [Microbacterium sp. 4R-513]|uniref:hypothetical protein n=1 Tax=Microbacterium sp. 4R-513 TaxID=2567934 RepID=UPI0013E1B512|nr:hypothetical protein [Microbacterium sp. 4R-513]QIG40065.1 hypothetical protein G5T42_11715 [Microbacterium sp. 4R-513]